MYQRINIKKKEEFDGYGMRSNVGAICFVTRTIGNVILRYTY